jgi:glycosyltransferase involved in cell wall biosynthesis
VERTSRLACGLWYAFVAAREFNWPPGLVAPQVGYFQSGSTVTYDGISLPNASLAIWELREDVQQAYPLDTDESVGGFLVWLLRFGLSEMGLTLEDLGQSFRELLLSESPGLPGVERICAIAYAQRPDLRAAFDLTTASGREAFDKWRVTAAADVDSEPATAIVLRKPAAVASAAPSVRYAAIALSGQWFAPTGRGEDIRCSAISLQRVGFVDFVIVDLPSGAVLAHDGSALPQGIAIAVQVNVVHHNADTAYSDWRRLRKLKVSAEVTVGFWAWELERLPSYWRHAFSFYDEVWASTRFARMAFVHEKLRPIRLMPMAVMAPEARREISRRELGLPRDTTVFVFVFDFRSFATRKNPEAVASAFMQAFPSGEEKAYLVIKSMGAQEDCGRLRQLVELCRDPRISIRDLNLDRDELIGLIKASDAFVSLHRSEGFGRGPAEAMLFGKPTILTAYSGTDDLVNANCAYLIDCKLILVAPEEYVGVESQRWADANVATAARAMRRVHDNPKEARRIGLLGQARVSRLLSPDVVGVRMRDALKKLCTTATAGAKPSQLPHSPHVAEAVRNEVAELPDARTESGWDFMAREVK